jgi:large subunit ribosomal protein L5
MAMERLKSSYQTKVRPELMKRFNYTTPMAVPMLVKVVVNQGLGEAKDDSKLLEKAQKDMALITLQKPIITKSKKSVSNFKLRAGQNVGLKVTLRGEKMYTFLEKLLNIALPRIRDFRGINPNSFDGRGNYNLGIKEQMVFPEITYEMVDATRGFDITVVTTAKNDEEARALLEGLGFPFKK